MKNTTITCIRLMALIVCITSAPWSSVNAQPKANPITAPINTPNNAWNFEFVNMNTNPIDIEVIDMLYFDADNPDYHPILLQKTPIAITSFSTDTGIKYGRLRSNIDLNGKSIVHIIVYSNKHRDIYPVMIPSKNGKPHIHAIYHSRIVAVEQNNGKFIELTPE